MTTKKTPPTNRPCKDCKTTIPYIPRKVRCMNCYSLHLLDKNSKIKFIPDDD